MKDLTYGEYLQFLEGLNISTKVLNEHTRWLLRGNSYTDYAACCNTPVLTLTQTYDEHFVRQVFDMLGEKISPLLKYSKWREGFIGNACAQVRTLSGTPKNNFMDKLYSVFKLNQELSLSKKENRDFFITIFKFAVNFTNKNEEQSVVKIMHDLFKNKEQTNLDLDFFKEIFAIYIENVKTDPKYQTRINEIKKWGKDQDFSALASQYKNIRHYFDDSKEEKIFSASVKTYDLKSLAKQNKIKFGIMQQNFNALNNFLTEKLKGNANIQDFIVLDEKIFYKVLIIYEKRDAVIDAAINIHDNFFLMIRETENVEKELMAELWKKLSLKIEIESSLTSKETQEPKIEVTRRISKI